MVSNDMRNTDRTGHELLSHEQDGDKYIFFVKKAK